MVLMTLIGFTLIYGALMVANIYLADQVRHACGDVPERYRQTSLKARPPSLWSATRHRCF